MKKKHLFICFLISSLCLSCSNDNKQSLSNSNIKNNSSIYIESGSDIRGMTIETHNSQKNSEVIQNDAINTNENGVIKIGN